MQGAFDEWSPELRALFEGTVLAGKMVSPRRS